VENWLRKYSSADQVEPIEQIAPKHPIPMYWVRREKTLLTEGGNAPVRVELCGTRRRNRWGTGIPFQRLCTTRRWNRKERGRYRDDYTVKLTVDGKSYTKPLSLKMDPRVQSTASDLTKQFAMQREGHGRNERELSSAGAT